MLVLTPFADIEAPPGVELRRFDGGTPPPDELDRVEVYVLPDSVFDEDPRYALEMPKLKVLHTLTAGYNHVLPFLRDGVTLCNARGVYDASTSELAVGLILASLRGLPDMVRAQQSRDWCPAMRPSLADRTVLIVGYGSIGGALDARLAGFEVDVVRVARHSRPGVHGMADLGGLLPKADVVVLTVPLTEETDGLVDAEFLAKMHDGALLVNVSRGPVVRTDALLAELATGRINAALDVTDPEPLPADHPLWHAPGCLISPHVGGSSSSWEPRGRQLIVDQLGRIAAGEPLINVVRPGTYPG